MNFFEKIKQKISKLAVMKLSTKDKINFLDQLSNLLHSGIPITNSVKIMIYQTRDKKIKIMLQKILDMLNKEKYFEL